MLYASRSSWARLLQLIVVAVAVLALAPSADAAICNISIDDMNFGNVDTLAQFPTQSVAEVFITCDNVSAEASVVTVCGNFGPGSGGATSGTRHMVSGADRLDYQLYTDSGRSVPWGAHDAPDLGSPHTIHLASSGGSASGSSIIYGSVFGSQIGAPSATYRSLFSAGDVSFIYAEGDTLNCSVPAGGSSAETIFSIQATVSPNCLVQTTDIDFGQHGVIDADVTAVGEVRVTCTPNTDYTVSLGGGLSSATDPEQRFMRSGDNIIVYGLYADANHTSPWGASARTLVPGIGVGTAQSLQVYGLVRPQASVPGVYADTVVVTITYQ